MIKNGHTVKEFGHQDWATFNGHKNGQRVTENGHSLGNKFGQWSIDGF